MKWGVLIFPGTWSHQDFAHVFQDVLKVDWDYIWHKETSVAGYDCLFLPGGFAHGDYLRCGAIARFSPVMDAVIRFAREGGPVMGSCNGFQILCEARAGISRRLRRWPGSGETARSFSAIARPTGRSPTRRIPTGRWRTSPGSATRAETSSASCPIRSGPARSCWAPRTADCCSNPY
jgi:hypothetical protein